MVFSVRYFSILVLALSNGYFTMEIKSGWWNHFNRFLCFVRYKFDDERVTKEDMKRALEEQYGGEEEVMFL